MSRKASFQKFLFICCIFTRICEKHKQGFTSGVATGVARGAECHPWQQKFAKNREKSKKIGKNREKEEKSGRKGKNREASFTLPLLTDKAGYATEFYLLFFIGK